MASALSRVPSARTIARLMTVGRDRLSKAETLTVAAIEGGVEILVEAREVLADLIPGSTAPKRPSSHHSRTA
jgi:hypothetical protein